MISITKEQEEMILNMHEGNITLNGTSYCVWCGEVYRGSKGGYYDCQDLTTQKLHRTDFVLISRESGMPVEDFGVIYGHEAVKNGEVEVAEGEDLVSMTKLPPLLKQMYLENLQEVEDREAASHAHYHYQ